MRRLRLPGPSRGPLSTTRSCIDKSGSRSWRFATDGGVSRLILTAGYSSRVVHTRKSRSGFLWHLCRVRNLLIFPNRRSQTTLVAVLLQMHFRRSAQRLSTRERCSHPACGAIFPRDWKSETNRRGFYRCVSTGLVRHEFWWTHQLFLCRNLRYTGSRSKNSEADREVDVAIAHEPGVGSGASRGSRGWSRVGEPAGVGLRGGFFWGGVVGVGR